MAPATRTPTPWEFAKPILEKDILDGVVTDDMFPRHVKALRPEIYGKVGNNFGSNYRTLQKGIREKKEAADEDALFLEHDKLLYTLAKDDPSCWHGSEAERLLPIDLDTFVVDGKLPSNSKPKKLWETRDEYKIFDLDVFRKHVHQELRSRKETSYWTYKMRKKEHAKKKAAALKEGEVFDDDFYVLEM